jgi:hypothetical protein
MAGKRAVVGRRRFMVGTAVGGVFTALGGGGALADVESGDDIESASSDDLEFPTALASVVSGASAGASTLIVRSNTEQFEVRPVGFPSDWDFLDGDLVAVNQETAEARPYVRTVDGETTWIALNDDPARERVIASR